MHQQYQVRPLQSRVKLFFLLPVILHIKNGEGCLSNSTSARRTVPSLYSWYYEALVGGKGHVNTETVSYCLRISEVQVKRGVASWSLGDTNGTKEKVHTL